MVLLPTTTAHDPAWDIPTYAFINVSPNPVGVNQKVSVLMWLDKTFDPSIALTNDWRFHNYNLTITFPDGHIETEIFETVIDTTSSQFYAFTPTQVGNYTFDFDFPGQDYNTYSHNPASAFVNDTYLPSHAKTTLTVQEEPLPNPITSYPLPTEYWTRPIYGENTDWWSISSNWLGTGAAGYGVWSNAWAMRNPGDAVGPLTGHIMWTKSLQSGGVAGGNNFEIQGDTEFEGSAYNQRYSNPIIVNGKLYYNDPVSFTGTNSGPLNCVDLRTGQLLWSKNIPQPSFALLWDVQDPNQHGVYPAILFTANFAQAYDADTGTPLFNVTNVPSGASLFGGGSPAGAAVSPPVMGPWGEQLKYVMQNIGNETNPNWRLMQWNSTNLWSGSGFQNGQSGTGLSPAASGVIDGGASTRYDYNISIPWANAIPMVTTMGMFGPTTNPGFTVLSAKYGDVMICMNGTFPGLATSQFGVTSSTPYTYFAVNLNASKGAIGTVMWRNTVTAPAGNITVISGPVDYESRVFVEAYKETMQWVGYNMDTGAKIWGPTESQTAFDYYGNPALPYINGVTDNGKLYSAQLGGILYAYDLCTGDLLWTYGNGGEGNSTSAGFYNAYGVYPTFINAVGSDGTLYTVTTEHTVSTPIYKGSVSRAINGTDGSEIWKLNSYVGEFFAMSYAMADGYSTWFNGYSNEIYVVGRGPSAITVDAPLTSVAAGNSIVIQGTVKDIASGTTQNEQAARFPNGVPLASDKSMENWMGYVYQQKPLPMDFQGVTVSLYAVDPNGNYITLGDATSDAYGTFHYTWATPNVPGDYAIYASFAGTNAYWPSTAATHVNVGESSATPAPTEAPPASVVDQYFLPAVAAIIIAIVLVGAVIMLMVNKRP
ncbi:MAG: PQQ-binding-like beta-propeller repeat protein [Candidatus Bathyarchaeota archaeon]|nr:PQQ-binding-like beta-propeller repeat protein [Candidatus Bathyarchaeota archaeon]